MSAQPDQIDLSPEPIGSTRTRMFWGAIFLLIAVGGAFGAWRIYHDDQKLVTLTVAAGQRGSDSHTLMDEISEVLIRHSSKVRLKIVEGRNSSTAISMINQKLVDLASIQSNTPAYKSVNLVADLFADYFLLITRRNSGIENVSDLLRRRVAIPEDGSSGSLSFWSVIDHYKLPPEGFRSISVKRVRGVEALMTGGADALFLVSSLRDPFLLSFLEEAGLRNIDLKFVPIDQAEAMALKRPFLEPAKIILGAFDGGLPLPNKDIVTPSLHRLLVAGSHVDEDAVQELVKVIFENRLDLLIRMALSSGIKDPRQEGVASLPLHPGAQRFYDRDKPSFLQENAEPMALMVTLFAMIVSALLALRRSLNARAKNRGDDYNVALLELSKQARESGSLAELEQMKTALQDLLELMVAALDTDQVTEDGFQSFAFLWGSVRDTINEKAQHLEALGP